MENILYIVNNSSFVPKESKGYIIDSGCKLKEMDWIKSELYKDGIIIEAELNWECCMFTEFYGFELIKEIRQKHRIKSPIIICSVLPETYFAEAPGTYFNCRIVNAPSHYYIEIDPTINHITQALELLVSETEDGERKCIELDDLTLDDFTSTFYDIGIYVGNIIHDLLNKSSDINSLVLNELMDNSSRFIGDSFNELMNIVNKDQIFELKCVEKEIKDILRDEYEKILVDTFIVEEKRKEIIQNIFFKTVDQFKKRIRSFFPISRREEKDQVKKQLWEVLYIEDFRNQREKVISLFKKKKVTCHGAANYREAKRILRDKKEKIAIVISDLRIYKEEGSLKFDDYQGYRIIKEIKSLSRHPMAYFILTTKENTIKRQAGISDKDRILWYSKDDVIFSEGGFNIFFNEVSNAANNSYTRNIFQPKAASWITGNHNRFNKPLGVYYKIHCESADYNDAEAIINQNASMYVKNVLSENKERLPQIAWTTTITSKKLSEEERNKEDLDAFRKYILTGRRIVLGLAYNGMSIAKVYEYLCWDSKAVKESKNDIKKLAETLKKSKTLNLLINTHLCLPVVNPAEDIPDPEDFAIKDFSNIKILLEEIEFLHDYVAYRYSAYDIQQLLSPSSAFIELCGEIREYINMKTGGNLLYESPFYEFEGKLFDEDDFSIAEMKNAFNNCIELTKDASNKLKILEIKKIIDKYIDSISENVIKDFLVSIF